MQAADPVVAAGSQDVFSTARWSVAAVLVTSVGTNQ